MFGESFVKAFKSIWVSRCKIITKQCNGFWRKQFYRVATCTGMYWMYWKKNVLWNVLENAYFSWHVLEMYWDFSSLDQIFFMDTLGSPLVIVSFLFSFLFFLGLSRHEFQFSLNWFQSIALRLLEKKNSCGAFALWVALLNTVFQGVFEGVNAKNQY